MSALATRPKATADAPARTALAAARAARRRRRIPVAVAGVVVFGAAVIAFADLEPRIPHAVAVLVTARPLTAGHVISAADLRVAEVTATGFSPLAVTARASVIGRPATVDVPAGAPLVAADVGATPGPRTGQAVIGLALRPGEAPHDLRPGDTVGVVATPRGPAGSAAAPSPARPAVSGPGAGTDPGDVLALGTVWSVDLGDATTEVGVVVPVDTVAAVASAAANDGVTLVWVPR